MKEKSTVNVIICNSDKSKFFIQQKDDTYHLENYRKHFIHFGGAVDEGETFEEAIVREVREEIEFASIVEPEIKYLFDLDVSHINLIDTSHVYCAILDDDVFDRVALGDVYEGIKAVKSREELFDLTWIPGGDLAVKKFLDM